MRKQIAAANWKMNLTYEEGKKLLNELISSHSESKEGQEVVFAVPFPYLQMAVEATENVAGMSVAAQNCSDKKKGAYTGEVSAPMLQSMGVTYCVIGHSERREYFIETNKMLAEKVNVCLEYNLTPLFCCGEALSIREREGQNDFVEVQLEESLFHLTAEQIRSIVIAYEPIWAIGTGKTATTAQAQEMHAHIRSVLSGKYGADVASEIPILYGGSVKGSNAEELFAGEDVDGGLVGGSSLIAGEFLQIIKALKDRTASKI
ncbi:MAG TPA: triose-phosphate isomerase [Flavisolibacter sp.]